MSLEEPPAGLASCEWTSDLARQVYCLLGIPIDACELSFAVEQLDTARVNEQPFLLSTPNINFLMTSLREPTFRESLVVSDFCPADGMPLIWIARLLGLPIRERVSGSDIFDALAARQGPTMSVVFFGGAPGVAAESCRRINQRGGALRCAGAVDPGNGTVEELSADPLLNALNEYTADFLVVALGAQKGQEWLVRNHTRIRAPVRSHLGAVVNFHAGSVRRAPIRWRRLGFEWLWRIREEPQLWRRYWADGKALTSLGLKAVLPLMVVTRFDRLARRVRPVPLSLVARKDGPALWISIGGHATDEHVAWAISRLKETLKQEFQALTIDLTMTRGIDQRFLGLLLMVRKVAARRGASFAVRGASSSLRRRFHLNRAGYLLS
jgi:N-acetylglucosaminyldiphosphoundecaprenol N-acetyl-beta-D-mannosaminyltransferase